MHINFINDNVCMKNLIIYNINTEYRKRKGMAAVNKFAEHTRWT